jgi:hypothetical protein
MRPLIIGPEEDRRCREIREYAFANPYSMDAMEGVMILGADAAPGANPKFRIIIPMGFRCVFTVEQQPEPVGLVTHLSVSLADGEPGAMPNPIALTEIQRTFGLTNQQITDGFIHSWIEPIDYDPGQAINIMNKVEVTAAWIAEVNRKRSGQK